MLKELKEIIGQTVSSIYPEIKLGLDEIELTKPEKKGFGDRSTNIAFKIGKQLGKNPQEVATEIAKRLEQIYMEQITKAEAVNGFVNLFLCLDCFRDSLRKILKEKNHFGESKHFEDQNIMVEFISANPTGPLTLGNGRGGFGGDVLANLFKKAGANVTREYYINDGGNQVVVLGKSILFAADLLEEEEGQDIYKGEYINEWLSKNKESAEKYKDDPCALGQIAADDLLNNLIKPSIKKMDINFESWFSERTLYTNNEVEDSLNEFTKKELAFEKEGALWFKTTAFGDDKDRVLVKSDGENTYFANDATYHFNKFAKRKFDKAINLWGADHHGYVGRLKAAVTAMGFGERLDIVIMQLVRLIEDGKEIKMSKRKGTYVTMDDLIEMIGGPEKQASDVARFFFLSRAFNTHMDFDLKLAKETSDKNPVFYVKYAYARLSGILRQAKEKIQPNNKEINFNLLKEDEEMDLIDSLSDLEWLPSAIVQDNTYPIHMLTFYAQEIAKKFHNFYDKCRVIDEENLELTAARLELVKATKIALGIVMKDLLGLEAPEKM